MKKIEYKNKQSIFSLLVLGIMIMGGFLFFTPNASAAGQCFCYTDLTVPGNVTAKQVADPAKFNASCIDVPESDCKIGTPQTGAPYTNCFSTSTPQGCLNEVSLWRLSRDKIISVLEKQSKENIAVKQRRGLIGAILPTCVFEQDVQGDCRDVSIFIKLGIDIADVLLTIIGSLALAMFIYGGFVLILSEGSQEKVKKGTGSMIAALIGLAVVFGAYLLVKILGNAIGIEDNFNLL